MNETLKTIANRHTCRDFCETPLTDEQIQALVRAALAAPSAMNRQPWHVIVVTDKAFIDEMDDDAMSILADAEDKSSYERFMARGGRMFYNAPCMFMVATPTDWNWASLDCGILTQNVALAAHSLGLGSCICGMANVPLTGKRGEEFKARLKFPEGYGFGMAILVGTAKTGKEPHELDFEKISYVEAE